MPRQRRDGGAGMPRPTPGSVAAMRRRRALFAAVAAAGVYAAYKAYTRREANETYVRLRAAVRRAAEAVNGLSTGAAALGKLAKDVAVFLESEDDEVPQSVLQACKLLQSDAVAGAAQAIAGAAARGTAAAMSPAGSHDSAEQRTGGGLHSLVDLVLTKVFSERGEKFAAAVCGRVARDAAEVLAQRAKEGKKGDEGPTLKALYDGLVAWSERPASQHLVATCAATFARSATEVYMAKSSRQGEYAHMLDAVAENPHRREVVVDMVETACRVAVNAFREATRPHTPAAVRYKYAARAREAEAEAEARAKDTDAERAGAAVDAASSVEGGTDGGRRTGDAEEGSGPPTPDHFDIVTPGARKQRQPQWANDAGGELAAGGGLAAAAAALLGRTSGDGGDSFVVTELSKVLPLLAKPEHRRLVKDVTSAATGEVYRSMVHGSRLSRTERRVASDPVGSVAYQASRLASRAMVCVTTGLTVLLYAVTGPA